LKSLLNNLLLFTIAICNGIAVAMGSYLIIYLFFLAIATIVVLAIIITDIVGKTSNWKRAVWLFGYGLFSLVIAFIFIELSLRR
jgi:hypothetical protein